MRPSSRRALLVEDEPVFSQPVRRLLEEEGWGVEHFPDGASAVLRLQQEPAPDLVLLDLLLPGTNGWDLYRQMRLRPSLRDVPIFVLTGASVAPGPLLAGIVAFLRKPPAQADRARFEEALRQHLRRVGEGRLLPRATYGVQLPPALVPLLEAAPGDVRDELLRRLTETAWLGLVPDWAPGQPHPRMVLSAGGYQLTVELDQMQRVVRTLGLKTPLRAWVDLGA